MVAFSGTNFDIDDKETPSPAHTLKENVVDLRRMGEMTDGKREDPLQLMKFNDPLFPKQWHLVNNHLYHLLTCASLTGRSRVMM